MSPQAVISPSRDGHGPASLPITDAVRVWAWGELLEAIPDAIVAADEQGTIVATNQHACELFGYTREQLTGATIDILVPDEVRAQHVARREAFAAHGGMHRLEARPGMQAQRADGTTFDVEVSLAPLMTDRGRLIIAAVRDMTKLMEAEEAEQDSRLEAERERINARAERARRLESLGLLAGGVAHDFNNLLSVIINYTALVEKQLGPGSELLDAAEAATAREDLHEVRQAGERAAALTRELLNFSRGEMQHDAKTADVATMIRSTAPLLDRSIGKAVQIELDLPEQPLPVRIDSSRFEQVLFNLVINARDAMPAGGMIRVEADLVEIEGAYAASRPGLSAGRHVRVSVSDEGVGMSPEVVASAFDPFFTTKEAGQGSGLGLSTVYGIVREAGGDTKIYSEVGAGTTVTVTLPCPDADPAAPRDECAGRPVHGSREQTVLVAEDEEPLRRATARLLRDAGFDVVEAPDGDTALAMATGGSHAIDLVLSDVVMPGLTGTQLAHRLASARPELPVVLMSGYSTRAGDVDASQRLIAKPFTECELLAAVEGEVGVVGGGGHDG
jgi:hypothetical protein